MSLQRLALASIVFFAAGVAVSSCAASREALVSRASFDLRCPDSEVKVVEIDARTRGVEGCGRRLTYIESCEYYYGCYTSLFGCKNGCTWVLNTDERLLPAPSDAAPTAEPDASDDEAPPTRF